MAAAAATPQCPGRESQADDGVLDTALNDDLAKAGRMLTNAQYQVLSKEADCGRVRDFSDAAPHIGTSTAQLRVLMPSPALTLRPDLEPSYGPGRQIVVSRIPHQQDRVFEDTLNQYIRADAREKAFHMRGPEDYDREALVAALAENQLFDPEEDEICYRVAIPDGPAGSTWRVVSNSRHFRVALSNMPQARIRFYCRRRGEREPTLAEVLLQTGPYIRLSTHQAMEQALGPASVQAADGAEQRGRQPLGRRTSRVCQAPADASRHHGPSQAGHSGRSLMDLEALRHYSTEAGALVGARIPLGKDSSANPACSRSVTPRSSKPTTLAASPSHAQAPLVQAGREAIDVGYEDDDEPPAIRQGQKRIAWPQLSPSGPREEGWYGSPMSLDRPEDELMIGNGNHVSRYRQVAPVNPAGIGEDGRGEDAGMVERQSVPCRIRTLRLPQLTIHLASTS